VSVVTSTGTALIFVSRGARTFNVSWWEISRAWRKTVAAIVSPWRAAVREYGF